LRRIPAILLLAATSAWARDAWVRAVCGNFEVFTNAGERTGRDAASRFEWARRIFSVNDDSTLSAPGEQGRSARAPSRPAKGFSDTSHAGAAPPPPVRVMLFATESEYRTYRLSESTSGYYQSGPERDYIVFYAGAAGMWRIALHEYVHLALNHSTAHLPKWLEEGTAEVYSTIEESNGRVRIGRPVNSHVATLNRKRWLPADVLAEVEPGSPYYTEREKAGIFYAESWALVHMLNFAPDWRDSLPSFAQLLATDRPAGAAFEQAFGRTMEAAIRALGKYVEAGRFPVVEVQAPSAGDADVRVSPLPPLDIELARAELLALIGREVEADKIYRRMAAQNPKSPPAQTGLGAMALRAKRYSEARDHLKRAIDLGSRDASTYFEYAMLLREQGGGRAEVLEHLNSAATLNPRFAEAHFILGIMASEDGRQLDAVEHLPRATAILPRQSYFWHALAIAYQELGRADDARRAAGRALDTAASEHEAEMARAAIKLAQARPEPAKPKRPAVTTPETWNNPRGDSRLEGTLERIDCVGEAARFYIRSGERTVALWVAKPGEVLLQNLSSATFTFRCGRQESRRVLVVYRAREDAATGTAGEITSIEFP
jgi:tetratricopeptide (TPR) repeat protein